jgi:hypothetical protein
MTSLLQITDKYVTVHNKCSKIPQSTINFAARVRRSSVVLMSGFSSFFVRAAKPTIRVRN